MLRDIEQIVLEAGLEFTGKVSWSAVEGYPHIDSFSYKVERPVAEDEDGEYELKTMGTVDGYRITQDWTVQHDLTIWEEADALDGDVVSYVEGLIREVRVCEKVFEIAIDITSAQHILIVRHFEFESGEESSNAVRDIVASLIMMNAPVLVLVDPWPIYEERVAPKGKLHGRGRVRELLKLGLKRMVGSRFLWGWNREQSEGSMSEYSYEQLLKAKECGDLDGVLKSPIHQEVYGPGMTKELAEQMGLPDGDDLMVE